MNRDCKMNRLILITRNILQYLQTMEDFFMKNVVDVLQMLQKLQNCGALAELVYALVLGTSVFGHVSSSLMRPTKLKLYLNFPAFTFFIKTVSAILCLKDCSAFASVRLT